MHLLPLVVEVVELGGAGGPSLGATTPFVGQEARDYLVGKQLSGFTFGNVITDFGTPSPPGGISSPPLPALAGFGVTSPTEPSPATSEPDTGDE